MSQREIAVAKLKDFEEVVSDDFGIDEGEFAGELESIADEFVSEVEPVKQKLFPLAAARYFSNTGDVKQDAYLAMVLAREQHRFSTDTGTFTTETRSDLKRSLREIIGGFEFTNPGENERRFLHIYGSLKTAIETGEQEDDAQLFKDEVSEPAQLYINFVHRYLPFMEYPEFDAETRSEREKLRSRVIGLVQQGELSTGDAGRRILGRIRKEEKEILDKYENQDAYIVFLNLYMEITRGMSSKGT